MEKPNPFQTFAHCWRFAQRRAAADGDTFHIVWTGVAGQRRIVLSERALFTHDDFAPDDIEASADPFLSGLDTVAGE